MAKYIALGTASGVAALASLESITLTLRDMYKDYSGIEKFAGYCAAYSIPTVFVAGAILCAYMYTTKDRTQSLEKTTTSSPSLPLKK